MKKPKPFALILALYAVASNAFAVEMKVIDCVLAADATQELVLIMNTQQGTLDEKVVRWKKLIEPADLPKKYILAALAGYLANRPTSTLPLAQEIATSCTDEMLKPYPSEHAPFCYSIASASRLLFQARKSGKQLADVIPIILSKNSPAANSEKTTSELAGVAHEIYLMSINTDPDAFKVVYFERCLQGNGSAYKR